MNKSDSVKNISVALLKAQSEMGNAVKGASNPFFKSKFADLNSIREACIPVLNKHGITVLQPMTVVGERNYIETTLLHESGEFLSSLTEIVVNKQADPQAQGSGQSYARRYGLQAFLCIGADDDDGEKAMQRGKVNKPTVTPVTETVKAVNSTAGPTPVTNGNGSASTTTRASFRKPVATTVVNDGSDI